VCLCHKLVKTCTNWNEKNRVFQYNRLGAERLLIPNMIQSLQTVCLVPSLSGCHAYFNVHINIQNILHSSTASMALSQPPPSPTFSRFPLSPPPPNPSGLLACALTGECPVTPAVACVPSAPTRRECVLFVGGFCPTQASASRSLLPVVLLCRQGSTLPQVLARSCYQVTKRLASLSLLRGFNRASCVKHAITRLDVSYCASHSAFFSRHCVKRSG